MGAFCLSCASALLVLQWGVFFHVTDQLQNRGLLLYSVIGKKNIRSASSTNQWLLKTESLDNAILAFWLA